jgi:phosphoheptose isomerase
MLDPRHKNKILNTDSLQTYLDDYAGALANALKTVDISQVEKMAEAITHAAAQGHKIYVAGNGGSAAIADHLCCDWTKGTHCEGHSTIGTHSLSSNVALYSAIANDYGFERVFSSQITFFGKEGDVLIAISSSGNSPNIIQAVEMAKSKKMFVAGFSGFSGGKLKESCDANIYVAAHNYGIVEDCHQAVMHIVAQYIAYQRDNA